MKRLRSLHLFLFLFLAGAAIAESQVVEWARRGTGGRSLTPEGIAIDSSGNVYAVGYFNSAIHPIRFDGMEATLYGGEDIYLVKYDNAGTIQWIRSAGGTGFDEARGVCVDPSGNICITGFIHSRPCYFGPVTLRGSDSLLGFIAKYDALGNLIWASIDTQQVRSLMTDITCDRDGNLYVTGEQGLSSVHTFIAKYSPAGVQIWRNAISGSGASNSHVIAADDNGNIYAAGMMVGTLSFDDITVTSESGSNYDVYIAGYGPDGRTRWVRTENHGQGSHVRAIGTDAAGNCFIGGSSYTSGFYSRYGSNGAQAWTKGLGGAIYGMTVRPSGDFYLTGGFSQISIFDTVHLATPAPGERGVVSDAFLGKFTAEGRVAWVRALRGNKPDAGIGIAIDRSDNLYLTGSFGDDASGMDSIVADDFVLIGTNDRSVFTMKIGPGKSPSGIQDEIITGGVTFLPPSPNLPSDITHIRFNLSRSGIVRLSLYDGRGALVYHPVDGMHHAGPHTIPVNTAGLPEGIYYLRLVADSSVLVQRMVVMR